MNVGDLVRYGDGKGNPTGYIGIVVNTHKNSVVTVLWNNGEKSHHSIGWLVRIKESA